MYLNHFIVEFRITHLVEKKNYKTEESAMFIMQNILPMTKMFKTGLIYSSRIANPLSQTVKTAHFSNVGRLSTRKANITLLGCKDCGKKLLTWQFVRMFTVFSKPSVHSISKTLLNNGNNKFLIRTISEDLKSKQNTTSVLYIASAVVFMIGASYAGVPLYRMFCQVSYKSFVHQIL